MLPHISMECRAGADPELRFSASGVAVAKIRVVASSRKKEGDSWVDDKSCWLNVTCFKKTAENLVESIKKGDLLMVEGRLELQEWEKDGEKKQAYAVLADTIGPSLAFKGAKIIDTDSQSSGGGRPAAAADNDPWAGGNDEPPF